MADEIAFPGKDETTTTVMRELYAAPGDESYWSELERKIMARVTLYSERQWWEAFESWKRPGMIAAAVLLAVVGLSMLRFRSLEPEIAQWGRTATPTSPTLIDAPEVYSQSGAPAGRERTFQYVITH